MKGTNADDVSHDQQDRLASEVGYLRTLLAQAMGFAGMVEDLTEGDPDMFQPELRKLAKLREAIRQWDAEHMTVQSK